jgi:hypothetical protein
MRWFCENRLSVPARGVLVLAVLALLIGGVVGAVMPVAGHASLASHASHAPDHAAHAMHEHHHGDHHHHQRSLGARCCDDAADPPGLDDCATICAAMAGCALKFLPGDAVIGHYQRDAAPVGGVSVFLAEFEPDPLTPPPRAEA